jgi:hypothetical protein
MAELLLDNLASAIIHSAAFPQYPLRGVEQNIRFHLRNSPACRDHLLEAFDRFQLAGLALLSLKNTSKEQTADDLRALIARAADPIEKARRERLLHHLQTTDRPEPLNLAKYSFDRFCQRNAPADSARCHIGRPKSSSGTPAQARQNGRRCGEPAVASESLAPRAIRDELRGR